MGNLYQILGVSPKASPQEIRSAFRKLARQYHPDVNPSPTANEDFLRLAQAYRILSDRRLRSLYDRGVLVEREEYLRRKARQQVMERYFDDLVNQLLRRDYEEARARQTAVTTLVSLFLSTFAVALLRPPLFELVGWTGLVVCFILFGLGMWELVKNVRFSLKYYTADDDSTISLMHPPDVPDKPFTREEAWAFLIVGYLVSLGLGLLISYVVGGFDGMQGAWQAVVSLLLLPPMFVYLVARVRALGIFEIGKIQVR
jgi:hypothetical protein